MKLRIVALSSLVLAAPVLADEGMWTFNNFPSAEVKKKYGFEPTKEWLDQVRLASVRIAGGCSASVCSAVASRLGRVTPATAHLLRSGPAPVA